MGRGSRYPVSGSVAPLRASVTVSPTFDWRTSFTPVMRYPTSPTPRPWVGLGSGETMPTSSSSCVLPVDIIVTFSRGTILPSTTRTYVTTPR